MSSSQICMRQQRRLAVGREPAGQRHAEADGERLGLGEAEPAKPVAAPARASLLKVRRLMRIGQSSQTTFVGTILARRGAPCHPEGEARGTFRAAGKVPPFGFAQGKRCARDDNIALTSACVLRPTLHERRRAGRAERMLAENGALDIGREHRVCVGGMGVAEKPLHAARRIEAA